MKKWQSHFSHTLGSAWVVDIFSKRGKASCHNSEIGENASETSRKSGKLSFSFFSLFRKLDGLLLLQLKKDSAAAESGLLVFFSAFVFSYSSFSALSLGSSS